MLKKKVVMIVIICLLTIPIAIYISMLAHLILSNNVELISKINVNMIIEAFSNEKYRGLYLGLQVLLFLAIICIYIQSKNIFSSELVWITNNIRTPKPAGQGQYGTARWMTPKEYEESFNKSTLDKKEEIYFQEFNKGGLVVGYKKHWGKTESIYTITDNLHSITVGATRSGKTRTIVLQTIGTLGLAGESIIVSDPKGELYQYTSEFLKDLGYDVRVIDFKMPLKSDRYNFLQPVIDAVNRGDYIKAEEYSWDITQALVGTEDTKTEKIWKDGEMSIIAGSIMTVVYENKDKPEFQNLTNVHAFISEMCQSIDGEAPINEYISTLPPTHPATKIFGVARIAPEKTRGSFFTSALMTLKLFTSTSVYSMSCTSDFNIKDTGSRKRAIFIVLPDERLTYYSLASLFVNQQYVSLVEQADNRGGELEVRVNFVLDEFGNFTTIPAFTNMLTVGGGRNIRFNMFVQSFSQLESKYTKEGANNILDNCHTWLYLKTANVDTATVITKKLGNYTTTSSSRSASRSLKSDNNNSESVNLISRPLLTEEEVLRIERPYILIICSGKYPAITKMPDLSKWHFNKLYGLGSREHNTKVREMRQNNRPTRQNVEIEYWGIWEFYK